MNPQHLLDELQYKALRSSGAGGQHVNKVATKIQVRWDIPASTALTEEEKARLLDKLANRISGDGILSVSCDESRSQYKNKALAAERLLALVTQSLQKNKLRKKTRIPPSVVKKRLENKKKQAFKKANRKPPDV